MNILLVNSAAPELWGGGEKWFVEAAKWFNEKGHRTEIVARPDSQLMARARQNGVECIASKFGGDFDPMAMLRARETIRACRSDVVLTNFNKESWQFGVAANTLKIPVIARHGFTLWSKKLHHKLLAKRVLTKLIVNAGSIRDYYETLGIEPKDICVITNGVMQVEQRHGDLRRRLGISQDVLLLAAGGRLESQKRFDRLLFIAATLKQTQDFKLAIFGTGPHKQALQAQASKLGVQDSVTFMGFVPEFANIIGDADLLLLTSDGEGTPNVVLEAMAAGVPVLGFNVGAMESVLEGELSEFLIPAGEESAFQHKLSTLLADREALKKRGDFFKTRALNEFSFDRSMSAYLSILQDVLSAK